MRELPEMTVEKRISQTAHSVPAPNFDWDKELTLAMQMNEDAKTDHWPDRTMKIIAEYCPFEVSPYEIPNKVKEVLGFSTWSDLSAFVVDDMCLDFFNLCLQYCLKQGQNHKRERGFIDGSGIGYARAYINRLKPALEQCFDAKYFYKIPRPLEYSNADISWLANAIHPGHWSYPAGHGTKFLIAVEVLDNLFHLDSDCYRNLLIAACAGAMGRSGSLIHYPCDNLAGGSLTNLKEWK